MKLLQLLKRNPDKWELIGKTQDAKEQTTTLIFQNELKTKHKTLQTAGIEPETLESVLDWVDRYGNKHLTHQGKTYAIFKLDKPQDEPVDIAKLPIKPPPAKPSA